jgi:putative mRNA 3-end processing factor
MSGFLSFGHYLPEFIVINQVSLLQFTERGIYCQRAGVFIDPWKPVPKALITHAHSDHAIMGCQSYLCTATSVPILQHRLGIHQKIQGVQFGEKIHIHGVTISFHPAGHIVGSAQIRIEYEDEIWVVSGDYKTIDDHISEPYEPVRCHTFITESTFGLPVYQWPDQEKIFEDINRWWIQNSARNITSIISAYTLGKAQRLIQNVDHSIGPVFCHGAVESVNQVLRESGVRLKKTRVIDEHVRKEELQKALVIAPGSALSSPWMRRFREYSTATASGWMALRGRRQWQYLDEGFVLSDHADWQSLNTAIKATNCEQVIVTHGYSDIFAKWLRTQGYRAQAERTDYEGDDIEPAT